MSPSLLETLKKDLKPVRPLRPAWQIAAVALVVCLAAGIAAGFYTGNYGLEALGPRAWVLLSTAFLLGLGACAWSAAQWMSPTGKGSLLPVAVAWLLGIGGLWMGAEPGEFDVLFAMQCFRFGSIGAVLPALLLVWIFRRSSSLMVHRVASSAGLLAGFSGFLAIQIHCPLNDFWHMFTGHALLPVVWGLSAYLGARLVFRFAARG